VYAGWNGLAPEDLYQERDVPVTTDFREPIGNVLRSHMGMPAQQISLVFPDHPSDSGNVNGLLRI